MSSLDALTLVAAQDAKPPLGMVVPAFQMAPSTLPPGWVQLDGSLVSRAAYPDAAKVLGDVRFHGLTPTEVQTALVMRAGVQSVGSVRVLAIPGTSAIVAAFASVAPAGENTGLYRLWRSPDSGDTWAAVDLPVFPFGASAERWDISHLEWFGGGRVLLVLTGENTSGGQVKNIVACYSADAGATWTAKTVYSSATSYANVHSISASVEMINAGTGLYLIGYQFGNGVPATGVLCVVNPANGTVVNSYLPADGGNSQVCHPFGARDLGAGSHEIHYGRNNGGTLVGYKMTFSGAAFGAESGSVITNIASYLPTSSRRNILAAGADGSHYLASGTSVMRLPTNWTGALATVHIGLDNVGQRLLTNTLSNPTTGIRLDINTGVASTVPGMGSGRARVGTYWGHADVAWQAQSVVDMAPSVDRHFTAASQAGSFVVRTSRIADNFVSGLSNSPDATKFLSSANGEGWIYTAAGQLRYINITGNPTKLTVRTYAPANDYASYAHLPYLPGLMVRLR